MLGGCILSIYLKKYPPLCPYVWLYSMQSLLFLKFKMERFSTFLLPTPCPPFPDSNKQKKSIEIMGIDNFKMPHSLTHTTGRTDVVRYFCMKHWVSCKITRPFASASCQKCWDSIFLLVHCWSDLLTCMVLFNSLAESVEGLRRGKTICGVRKRVRMLSGTVRGTRWFLIFLNPRTVNPIILTLWNNQF